MKPPTNLHERRVRTEAVLAEFKDKPFSWKGRANCIHLARAQMAAFGHKPGPVPRFSTALGAKSALHKRGVQSVEALIDSISGPVRIGAASAWIGDLVLLPGEPFEALAIAVGGGFVMAWHEDGGEKMTSIQIKGTEAIAAWRL